MRSYRLLYVRDVAASLSGRGLLVMSTEGVFQLRKQLPKIWRV